MPTPTGSFIHLPRMRVPRTGGALLLGLTLSACGGGAGGDGTETAPMQPEPTESMSLLSGSVGDGPVIGAQVQLFDGAHRLVAQAISRSDADYTITFPQDIEYPITLQAHGGTDLVTQRELDFVLSTVALSADHAAANINPFSTLAVRIASRKPGGLNAENLNSAAASVHKYFGFTLDPRIIPDPINTAVNRDQALNLIPASEALAETIRRISARVGDPAATPEAVIDALADDLSDGTLDADATGLEGRISAAAVVIAAEVLLELLSDELMVEGESAMDRLASALASTAGVEDAIRASRYWSEEVRGQLQSAVAAAQAALPNTALAELTTATANLSPSPEADDFRTLHSPDVRQALQASAETVIGGESSLWRKVAVAANSPIAEPCNCPAPPERIRLQWDANSGVVDGYLVFSGPDAGTVSDLIQDVEAGSASFDPAKPSLIIDPETDLGLHHTDAGTSVCFSIKAYNTAGPSTASEPACISL